MANKYPGKRSHKFAADRTPEEQEQHSIYIKARNADHRSTPEGLEAHRAHSRLWRQRHREDVLQRERERRAANPIRFLEIEIRSKMKKLEQLRAEAAEAEGAAGGG